MHPLILVLADHPLLMPEEAVVAHIKVEQPESEVGLALEMEVLEAARAEETQVLQTEGLVVAVAMVEQQVQVVMAQAVLSSFVT